MTTTVTLSEPIVLHALPTVGCYYQDDEGIGWATTTGGAGETCAVCGLLIGDRGGAYMRGAFPDGGVLYVHPEHVQHGADIPPAPPSPYTSDEIDLRYEAKRLLKRLGERMEAITQRNMQVNDLDTKARLTNQFINACNARRAIEELLDNFAPITTDTTDGK